MAFRKKAKITVSLSNGDRSTKTYLGTEEEIYNEAHDWMNAVALRFIDDNNITDEAEQLKIIDEATHTITWDNDNVGFGYVIYDPEFAGEPPYAVFSNLADAEEAIFTECEHMVAEAMMRDTPMNIFGREEWYWYKDYWYLMADCANTFAISKIIVFD